MTYRAHPTLENHHTNGYNADHFYHFQKLQLLGVCQCPKFRVHPAPEVHDFAIRCMNFSSHFEHLICHIKYGADILARRMVLRGTPPYACIKEFLKFGDWFYV